MCFVPEHMSLLEAWGPGTLTLLSMVCPRHSKKSLLASYEGCNRRILTPQPYLHDFPTHSPRLGPPGRHPGREQEHLHPTRHPNRSNREINGLGFSGA